MKKIFLFILIAIIITGATILVINKIRHPPSQMTLVQPEISPDMALHYIALENNFFSEFETTVDLTTCSEQETPQQLLASEKANIAVMDLADFLEANRNNKNLIAFAPVNVKVSSFILSRDETEDFNWEDTRDKSIIPPSSQNTEKMLFDVKLKENELTPYRNVNILYDIPGDLQEGAFKSNASTYLIATEPTVSRLEKENAATVADLLDNEKIPALVYVTTKNYIFNNPVDIQRFTNGIYKSLLWKKEHPDQISEILAPEFKEINSSLMESIVNRYQKEEIWPVKPQVSLNNAEYFQQLMLKTNIVTSKVPLEEQINNDFADTAEKKVKYKPPKKQEEK